MPPDFFLFVVEVVVSLYIIVQNKRLPDDKFSYVQIVYFDYGPALY